jgi:hypothetical protein
MTAGFQTSPAIMARPTVSIAPAWTRYQARLLRMSAPSAGAATGTGSPALQERVPSRPVRAQNRAQRAGRGIVTAPCWRMERTGHPARLPFGHVRGSTVPFRS